MSSFSEPLCNLLGFLFFFDVVNTTIMLKCFFMSMSTFHAVINFTRKKMIFLPWIWIGNFFQVKFSMLSTVFEKWLKKSHDYQLSLTFHFVLQFVFSHNFLRKIHNSWGFGHFVYLIMRRLKTNTSIHRWLKLFYGDFESIPWWLLIHYYSRILFWFWLQLLCRFSLGNWRFTCDDA